MCKTTDITLGDETYTHVCAHKHLFDYFNYLDVIVTVLLFMGGSVAAGGGVCRPNEPHLVVVLQIGGGGIFVPILILCGYNCHSIINRLSSGRVPNKGRNLHFQCELISLSCELFSLDPCVWC